MNHLDIIIVSDDVNLPSQKQKRIVNISKKHAPNAPAKPCPGYQLHFPQGQQAHMSYPFALHTTLPLTWDCSVRRDGFFLISHLCTGVVAGNGRCKQCDDLGNNQYLQKIVARLTNGVHENSTLVYHGIGGLIDIVHRKTRTIDLLRLCRLNDMKKLVGKEGVIDMHKQMMLALSSQRIPRIDHVLRVGFRRGASIHTMLELIKKAAEGTYHPRRFDEEEDLQALLFLRLGGARVADVAHRIFGTPGLTMTWTHTIIPRILALPSFPMANEIGYNIAASFKAISDILGQPMHKQLHAVIMFDEISIEACPRWDDKTNKFLGVCREHGSDTSLEFTTEEDLQALWEELRGEKIHLAHEVCVNVCGWCLSNMSRS